jgi:hypothetical protein
MFKDSAAPTRANVKKRLLAAQEAMDSAQSLAAQARDPELRDAILRARGCIARGLNAIEARKGERF